MYYCANTVLYCTVSVPYVNTCASTVHKTCDKSELRGMVMGKPIKSNLKFKFDFRQDLVKKNLKLY